MKQTLLIIDVQNIMFDYKGGACECENVLGRIKLLLDKARGNKISVVYIQHTENQGPMAIGNPLREIHPAIAPKEDERVVIKHYWDSFMETSLKDVLDEIGTEQLIICGMQTEYCVDTTTRSAFAHGYRHNILVEDGHTTFDTAYASASIIRTHHNTIFNGRFAKVLKAEDIVFDAE